MRDYYEQLWERLPAQLHPPDLARRTRFLLAEVRAGQTILDLGCGDGPFTERMLEHADVTVTGADVAETALRRARARIAAWAPTPAASARASFVRVPFDGDLPFGDNRFDLVWASEVIEHVADTGRWLSEVRRVLKPGAQILLTTPNHTRLVLVTRGISEVSPPLGDHLHLYDRAGLTGLLSEFGFDAVRVRAAGRFGPLSGLLTAVAVR